MEEIRPKQHRFPFAIVWTPIPIISWIFPWIGHMGIGMSNGVIRDFAGSYYVSEDDMAFGWPTLYHQLSPNNVDGGTNSWDRAVTEASEEYKTHTHNLFCDNCHSFVALALNKMKYDQKTNWNMLSVVTPVILRGKFVGFSGFLRQYFIFTVILAFLVMIYLCGFYFHY